jgi:hydroxymethylbilane synthase
MTRSLPLLRLGTRGSPLALAQAHEVKDRLAAAHPELAAEGSVEIVVIKTTGDRIQDRALMEIGGKGLFTKEIDHSMKDVPTWLPDGLAITAILEREDPRDAWFARGGQGLAGLPAGAVVGTAALRRQAQVLHARPDLSVATLRGNVQTRLAKLERGEVDATLLALAGLKRLGKADLATAVLSPEELLPAVAQGAIGLEIRLDDRPTQAWVAALDHPASALCVTAERALLAELDGSCRTPIAAHAQLDDRGGLTLTSLVALPDGSVVHRDRRQGPAAAPAELGRAAGQAMKAAAGPAFFAALAGG